VSDKRRKNKAIRDGLVIEGKSVSVRRNRRDPTRCWKCQQLGVAHQAATCKSIHDTCARCAGMHITKDCQVEDKAEYRCANCKATGHGAADRHCPVFLAKLRELRARNADQQYRFFPTKDPETWERDEEDAQWGEGEAQGTAGAGATVNSGRYGDKGAGAGARRNNGGSWEGRPRDNGWGGNQRDGRGGREAADKGNTYVGGVGVVLPQLAKPLASYISCSYG
jgi:hypothetical protein